MMLTIGIARAALGSVISEASSVFSGVQGRRVFSFSAAFWAAAGNVGGKEALEAA